MTFRDMIEYEDVQGNLGFINLRLDLYPSEVKKKCLTK